MDKQDSSNAHSQQNITPRNKSSYTDLKDGDEFEPYDDGRCSSRECGLIALRSINFIFIPIVIAVSIVFFVLWLLFLPIALVCPCCEMCTKGASATWKYFSELPMRIIDWICRGIEWDDETTGLQEKYAEQHPAHSKAYGATQPTDSVEMVQEGQAAKPESSSGVQDNSTVIDKDNEKLVQ